MTVLNSERFNFTKFLAALIMKESESLQLTIEDSNRYVMPLAKQMKKLLNDPVLVKSEIRDRLELIISEREATWLSNSLWLLFVDQFKHMIPSLADSSGRQPHPEQVV
jgi:hypothetical protein